MQVPSRSLEHLPTEILETIAMHVMQTSSLKSLSCVNRTLRFICLPHMFEKLTVRFSLDGVERLQQASMSYIAYYVKTICYEASEIIDPLIQCPHYFSTCLYTPLEYTRDEREFRWGYQGKQITYNRIYSYFKHLSEEQQMIIQADFNLMSFSSCLPRFLRLRSFEISLMNNIEKPFRWFAGRMLVDWKDTFPDHFGAVLQGLCAAKESGIRIKTFQVTGFYSRLPLLDSKIPRLAAIALHTVEELYLADSPGLLDFIAATTLPSVRVLELENCWLWVPELQKFLLTHGSTLQVLHLENVWLPSEKIYDWGVSLSLGTTSTVIDGISDIRIGDAMRELTINRKGKKYEYQKIFNHN
ncbi:hypothetical protein BO94DRAFT_601201 [Aspergillus sclerotioniger CBS 115572]|uniref:F-box domain-containing protein n=1 Tax=Aspergillus sclerotioniger CBS 115572 TaxID=1450535 RepID=A0A317XBM3_9EURO|nr:hypothetical protein BO94DRAFT_601201 [Aspergillus sclerotioniger CBS 115572]PWY96034.1 hypothetical protein BO94DRAFT_601201 [Aspergillus sclerotioniger CBS 115572]